MSTKTVAYARKQRTSKIIVYSIFGFTVLHTIYMNMMGFSPMSHDGCVVYTGLPKWMFYLYENMLELIITVVIGVFLGVLVEKYFYKVKRFYPKNQILAFAYGAILPICSCGVVPLIDSMRRRTSLKVIITFVTAAPLLNPYTIFVSFSVLGVKYGVIRIIASFLVTIIAGLVVQFIVDRFHLEDWSEEGSCSRKCDSVIERDPFVKTVKITLKLLPYILIAGILSFAFAMVNPKQMLHGFDLSSEPITTIIMVLIGIPMYVCNGADVVFLKPFMQYTDLTLGSAMAFSLSSSAVCISSITMLVGYLGKKVTIILTITLFVLIVTMSMLINLFVA